MFIILLLNSCGLKENEQYQYQKLSSIYLEGMHYIRDNNLSNQDIRIALNLNDEKITNYVIGINLFIITNIFGRNIIINDISELNKFYDKYIINYKIKDNLKRIDFGFFIYIMDYQINNTISDPVEELNNIYKSYQNTL